MTSHPVWAAVAASGAAAAYALTSILQHRAARAVDPRPALDPWLLLHLLRRRLWLIGTATDVIGIGLHTVALGLGALILVQPLVAGGILIAVPFDAALDHRKLSRKALLAVATGTAGLACFILAAAPSNGTDSPGRGPLAVALGCCLAACTGCLLINSHAGRPWRGTLLGLAAGIAYAGSGSLVKVSLGLLARGIDAVLLDWPLYALAVIGGIGLVLNQNAFQSRPLQPALVSMTLATPIASAAIGILAFGEHLAGSSPRTIAAILGAAAMATGVMFSSRATPNTTDFAAPADRGGSEAPGEEPRPTP